VDSSKLGVGEIIAGISGLALFVFMFLPWYGVDSVGGFGVSGADASAWEAFSFIDILLFLVAVVVVGLVIVQMAESTPDMPVPPAQILTIAGVVALVLILFRLVFAPDFNTEGLDVDVDLGRKIGIFLGLIAAAGITYGGWRAMQETPMPSPTPDPTPPTPTPDPIPSPTPDPVPTPTPDPVPTPTPDPVPPSPDPKPSPVADPAPPAPPSDEPPRGDGYSPPQQ
jgi:outer membrane biosynthesis protein TonB